MHPVDALTQIRDLSAGEDEAVHLLTLDALNATCHNDIYYYLRLVQRVQRLEAALEEIYRLSHGSGRHESVDIVSIRTLAKANLPACLFSPRSFSRRATDQEMEQADATDEEWQEWEESRAWQEAQATADEERQLHAE